MIRGFAAIWTYRLLKQIKIPQALRDAYLRSADTSDSDWLDLAHRIAINQHRYIDPSKVEGMRRLDVPLEAFDHTCSFVVS